MSNLQIGLASIVVILVLIQSGLHVAIALAAVSFFGVVLIRSNIDVAGTFLSLAALEAVARYSFGVIPLFVLMGLLVGISGLGRDVFAVAGQLFRGLAGGLGIATVFANAVFAAVNGTSIASASVFTRIAVPELLRSGYSRRFSVGVVAGSSVLGMLIPPSLLLILYGIIAEVSIGDLFTAGILPGIVLSLLFIATILLLARLRPGFVFADPAAGTLATSAEHLSVGDMAMKSLPVVLLILIVLGGIYGGVFTPTEAGAVGALAALIITVLRGKLGLRQFWDLLIETGRVTAAITFLIVAAHMYARLLALSGLPSQMNALIQHYELGLFAVMALYLMAVIALGTILDSSSIMLIVLPLILPVMTAFQVDLIWFGILTIIAVEVGLLTPPLGIACFVIKANLEKLDIPLNVIFAGAVPFVIAMLVMIGLVLLIPQLATALL
ncbi:TRAP transporter large permease [Mesorhizobium sp. CAU 1741]|uniref:TRAP transporter large permease n=1 Tax=Mesorhizobium sp. CAU 1741 TaxID=3140366 RepID=UPI00325BE13A